MKQSGDVAEGQDTPWCVQGLRFRSLVWPGEGGEEREKGVNISEGNGVNAFLSDTHLCTVFLLLGK